MIINSQIELGKKLKQFSEKELKTENMFFNSDWYFAFNNGGNATKEFLLNLPAELHNKNTIIDSRLHMLMPNWYPCIPGYHHDDVPRERLDKQPEYYNPSYRSKHALVLYNGDICPTEFAIGTAIFTEPTTHQIIYKEWHKEVIKLIKNNQLQVVKAPNNQIVYFNDRTWHQGTKTIKSGWRLFIRASWDTGRKATNEIRNQVQVYMDNPMQGW